jgi:hypothetical protein
MTMTRALILLATTLLLSSSAQAATLQGRIVNGTTGEPGRADLVEVYDVTKSSAAPVASVENVDGSFTLEGIPDAAAAHFRIQVTANGMQFTQAVPDFEGPQEIFVFDVTDDISDVVLLRHHVIFTRDPEHIQATEFFEFDNRTDPPRAIRSSALPMRLQLDHDMHGAPTASLMGAAVPIQLDLTPTDEPAVLGLKQDLQPGPTRVIVRYLLHEENRSLAWATRSIYETEERRLLVNPMDIEIESAGMVPTDPAIEGYATWAGLASAPGDEWAVNLRGGSAVAATDDHDHGNENTTAGFTEVVARPNRLTSSRTMILLGLGGVLLFGTLAVLGSSRRSAPVTGAGVDEARVAVSKIADRYVSGEITREEYERQAAKLLGKGSPKTTPAG